MSATGSVIQSPIGLSLWLPPSWSVAEENEHEEDPAQEARDLFELWHESWWESLSGDQRDLVSWAREIGKERLSQTLEGKEPTGFVAWEYAAALGGYMSVAEYSDPEANRAVRALILLLKLEQQNEDVTRAQLLGTRVAYLRAESPAEPGTPEVEVARYRFRQPLQAIDFYEAAKPSRTVLLWGTRPSTTYKIDGMDAIRFYALYTDKPLNLKVVFHYAVAGETGWEISCWGDEQSFEILKPTFLRIAESLHRLTT